MLETVEDEISLLEMFEVLKVLEVLYATPHAGGCGVFSLQSDWNLSATSRTVKLGSRDHTQGFVLDIPDYWGNPGLHLILQILLHSRSGIGISGW